MVKTEPQEPTARLPAPPIKEEIEEDDGFEDFPVGAVSYSREELFARMKARKEPVGVQEEDSFDQFEVYRGPQGAPQVANESGQGATDFSGVLGAEPVEIVAPVQEQLTPANTPPTAAEQGQNIAQQGQLADPNGQIPDQIAQNSAQQGQLADPNAFVVSAVQQLLSGNGRYHISIDKTDTGVKLTVETPEKDQPMPSAPSAAPVVPEEDTNKTITDSQASSVVAPHRRRLRVPSSSDEDEGEEEEEVENITPKKKAKAPETAMITPSPARRLRTLNLSPDSDDEDAIDDSQAETCPFDDSYRDPEYIPDTQEEEDRPADFRIPRTAPRDPLDLEY